MYKITEKVALNPTVTKMVIEAPLIAKKAKPGQFIIVRPFEDSERIPLTVAGYDREKGTVDIIFQIVGGTTMELNSLNVGDSVVAIGNPLGELTFSLTAGLVSAKDREVTLSNSLTMDLIQTDCAINSGNSGGALFNLYGEVIGITNAKYSSSSSSSTASIDNIGFAIPIDDVLAMVKDIMTDGYVTNKPYIGITPQNMTAQMAQQYRGEAENRVKIQLVLEAIRKAENIEPPAEDIDEQSAKQAKRAGQEVEAFKANLTDEHKAYLSDLAAIQKVCDLMKAGATVVDKKPEEAAETAEETKTEE